jgi:DNA-binding transcriptional MerR regulator
MEADDWHVSGLTVGQVAERMNIAPSAVRWYDDHGLLASERTAGNQRRFFADVLCRMAMIRASQRVGLSIEEIRQALSAFTGHRGRRIPARRTVTGKSAARAENGPGAGSRGASRGSAWRRAR